jgi:hypothetical protein
VYLNVVTWYIFIMFLLVQLPPHLLSFCYHFSSSVYGNGVLTWVCMRMESGGYGC